MDRRGFMSSILAFGVAPAVVRARNIMRVRPLILPSSVSFMDMWLQHQTVTIGEYYADLIARDGRSLGRCELPLDRPSLPVVTATATGVLSHVDIVDSQGCGWARAGFVRGTPNILTGDFVHIHGLRLSGE